MSRFPFPEFPNGWYQIANRSDLALESEIRRHYFDRDLSIRRGPSGSETIEVLDTSAASDAPGWPVAERGDLVFVWYHEHAEPPSWSLPALETFDEPGWSRVQTSCLEIRSHPQEICENTVDVAHLAAVHGMDVQDVGEIVVEAEEERLRVGIGIRIGSRPGADSASVPIQMWTDNYGPALGVVHLANPDGTETFSTYAPIPIGGGRCHYRISTALRRPGDEEQVLRALEHSHRYQCATVLEDVPIWENKVYWPRPKLSEVDGPIPKFRRWYAQYYDEAAAQSL